jgi:hypothetical protein
MPSMADTIKVIDKMSKTFGELSICFATIVANLNQVDVDLHAEDLQEVLIDYNLDQAAETWAKVTVFAKVFAETNLGAAGPGEAALKPEGDEWRIQ